jgi:hypothetical protein
LGTVASTRRTDDPRTPISDGEIPSAFVDGPPEPNAAPPSVTDRDPPRDGVARDRVDDDDSSTALAVEPSDPVLSAKANGSATTAEPTPNATASAPTRPTYDAITEEGDFPNSAGRRVLSFAGTRRPGERRKLPMDGGTVDIVCSWR